MFLFIVALISCSSVSSTSQLSRSGTIFGNSNDKRNFVIHNDGNLRRDLYESIDDSSLSSIIKLILSIEVDINGDIFIFFPDDNNDSLKIKATFSDPVDNEQTFVFNDLISLKCKLGSGTFVLTLILGSGDEASEFNFGKFDLSSQPFLFTSLNNLQNASVTKSIFVKNGVISDGVNNQALAEFANGDISKWQGLNNTDRFVDSDEDGSLVSINNSFFYNSLGIDKVFATAISSKIDNKRVDYIFIRFPEKASISNNGFSFDDNRDIDHIHYIVESDLVE